jgi:hypothetical protein
LTHQASNRLQEERAAQFLAARLQADGHQSVTWKRGSDPPDFEFEVGNQRWAVEVTRSDQRVKRAGKNASRADSDQRLLDFGNQIAKAHRPTVSLYYFLTLRPLPGVTDTAAWRRQVRRAASREIKSGSKGPIKLDGHGYAMLEGSLERPLGFCVLLAGSTAATPEGHLPQDIIANLEESIRYALNDKVPKLQPLSGFDKVVLILDNLYILADVADAVHVASRIGPKYQVIDFLFFIHSEAMYEIYRK